MQKTEAPREPGAIRWLKISEAAAYCGCHPVTLYKLVERGEMPGVGRVTPRNIRIDRLALDRQLEAGGLGLKRRGGNGKAHRKANPNAR